MKTVKTLLLATLLMLPISALATSVGIATAGGVLQFANSSLNLSGSTIDLISGGGKEFVGNLGTLNFSTGTLSSGSLATGAVFNAGGSFALTSNGSNGTHSGALFVGTFSGPSVWSVITLANGKHAFTLTGALQGTWFTGAATQGAVTVLTVIGELEDGKIKITSADINLNGANITVFNVVPEPSTYLYMGTGIIGIAGVLRRRFKG